MRRKEVDYDFIQYIINEDLRFVSIFSTRKRKLHGVSPDLLENNRLSLSSDTHVYHFWSWFDYSIFQRKVFRISIDLNM